MTETAAPGESYRFGVIVRCSNCGQSVDGEMMMSGRNQVIDSNGFVLFADGPRCDTCMGEGGPGDRDLSN
jgi:hypothetical protein